VVQADHPEPAALAVLTVQLVQAEHLALTDRLVHLVAVEQVVRLVQVVHRVHGVRRVQVEPVA
jgi:hypothetical protein